jgi:protein gp37
MGRTTIDWATHTVNPITGCTPASEGCEHCYAVRRAVLLARNPLLSAEVRARYDGFRPARFHPHRLREISDAPAGARVFIDSMGDLFHEQVNVRGPELREVFRAVASSDATCLALTKRPARMARAISFFYGDDFDRNRPDELPLRNLWLGVTAENQARAAERIRILLQIPAAKRFVSIEPMLGPVDLEDLVTEVSKGSYRHWSALECDVGLEDDSLFHGACLDWVICGGETGPGARPMAADWVRGLRDQCVAAGVPFFFKGWGGSRRGEHVLDGAVHRDLPRG